ncbi:copper resistance CopC/CopD family protein [Pseudalkalibacillus decolorationis]|uniref:copper resistance CopC/CopD family protein n=1 Tax=Pseudalkalibacillus decolorationis TaxID=163879 RepID=UPI002148984C|nr:copper resistance protein CopC/CopD [Pseudalkalibacillus decolorationis]
MINRIRVYFLLFIGVFLVIAPSNTFAHTSLSSATPSPNSELTEAPNEIVLEFSSNLENSQYYIKIYNSSGKKIGTNKATLSEDSKVLLLEIPDLEGGTYFVEYYVISADGHPISDRYGFTIKGNGHADGNGKSESGQSGETSGSANQEDTAKDSGRDQSDTNENGGSEQSETAKGSNLNPSPVSASSEHQHGGMLYWAMQMVYYLVLLILTGWLFWGNVSDLSAIKRRYTSWLKRLKMIFLFMAAGYGFTRLLPLLSDISLSNLTDLILNTTVGNAWLSSLILSILSFVILRKRKWIDGTWIFLVLITEAFSGHAAAFRPLWYSITFDVIHLAAAAVWVSGLILLFIIKKEKGTFLTPFTNRFSNYAFFSIIILSITGSLLALRYLSDLNDLFTTAWGMVLLLKIALVFIVVLTGYSLRKAIKKKNDGAFSKKIEWDFALMFAIIFLVGMLTSFSPVQ